MILQVAVWTRGWRKINYIAAKIREFNILRKAVAQKNVSLASDDNDDESIYKDTWAKK
jgi:hypothetical protein